MFWMTRECFKLLYQRVTLIVGKSYFRSETHIKAFLEGQSPIDTHVDTTGGFIFWEVKFEITLWLLSGGSKINMILINGYLREFGTACTKRCDTEVTANLKRV